MMLYLHVTQHAVLAGSATYTATMINFYTKVFKDTFVVLKKIMLDCD